MNSRQSYYLWLRAPSMCGLPGLCVRRYSDVASTSVWAMGMARSTKETRRRRARKYPSALLRSPVVFASLVSL